MYSSGILLLSAFVLCAVAATAIPVLQNAVNSCNTAGRFCFRNLTGWNECILNQHTGHYDDIKHYCEKETRCECYFGVSCPSTVNNPCAKYMKPPSLPDSFTFTFAGIRSTCTPGGCKNYTYAGVRYVDQKYGGRYRQDIASNAGLNTYIIPSGNKLKGYLTDWEKSSCTKLTFPKYLGFLIPSYFTYDLNEVVDGRLAKRWFWFEKLSQPTDIYVTNYIYSVDGKNPGETYLIRMVQKTFVPNTHVTDWVNETYTVFKTESHLDQRFKLPDLCNHSDNNADNVQHVDNPMII